MKCINKYIKGIGCAFLTSVLLSGCGEKADIITPYEVQAYSSSLYEGELYSVKNKLCVASENIELANYQTDTTLHAAALFGVNQEAVYYAYDIHEQLEPASTTKILTAYVALKYGNLSDVVTVGSSLYNLDPESSVAGLQVGDQLTMEDLIYGLLLPSGNDCALVVAEHISGSVDAFVNLMNEEAAQLMATNTHFTNPHGLSDPNHYTTAYDLYLMFNACLKDERFVKMLEATTYDCNITGADGTMRTEVFEPTNFYAAGLAEPPSNVTVVGGKTGTTNEAGACLILLERDATLNPYISIVMGGSTKAVLYDNMTALIQALPAGE